MSCSRYDNGKCASAWCYYKSAGDTCLNPRLRRNHTNADRIRGMSDEEIAKEVTRNPSIPCRMCEYWNREQCNCFAPNDFTCTTGYAEALTLDWLKAETEGKE